jgi:hypothetical protein
LGFRFPCFSERPRPRGFFVLLKAWSHKRAFSRLFSPKRGCVFRGGFIEALKSSFWLPSPFKPDNL